MQILALHPVRWAAAVVVGLSLSQAAVAAPVMPSFATVPAGWVTDRYDAASFSNVGVYQGRSDVLGIGINSSTDLANRGAPYQSTFYNTQGKQAALAGAGVGSVLSADLYIEDTWRSGTAGLVRTDMWAVGSDATQVTDYGIIGFTNYGGVARLRVFDGNVAGGWVDLATAVAFEAWTALEIELTSTSLLYRVNGVQVYADNTIGANNLSATIMQAYNFADPAVSSQQTVAYTAHWSNAQTANVPEPGSLALVAGALLSLGLMRRRQA